MTMDKIHHSISDWEFSATPSLYINDQIYVSPPSCLCTVTRESGTYSPRFYLSDALAHCVPEGKLVTYHQFSKLSFNDITVIFRGQTAPVDDFPDDCYWLRWYETKGSLYRREASINTNLVEGNIEPPLSVNTWHHHRVTWYEYISEMLEHLFRIEYEIYRGGDWQEIFHYDDPLNKWAASSVNRFGLGTTAYIDPYRNAIDDTEIWA